MSLFSFLGKAAKSVGKVALGVTKTAVNVAGTYVGVGPILGGGSAPAAPTTDGAFYGNQAAAPSLAGSAPQGAGSSLGGTLMGFLSSATDFMSGKTHAQVDTNVGVQTGGNGGGFPSWLLPVGIGAVALILLTGKSRR